MQLTSSVELPNRNRGRTPLRAARKAWCVLARRATYLTIENIVDLIKNLEMRLDVNILDVINICSQLLTLR
jgi:hypothetical protein